MSILKDDQLSPLFQEVVIAPSVTSKNKKMLLIFHLLHLSGKAKFSMASCLLINFVETLVQANKVVYACTHTICCNWHTLRSLLLIR